MKIVKITDPDKITGQASCVERDAVHAGPLYDVNGTFMCELHLFVYGRMIADTLAEARGLNKPPKGFGDEIKKDTQQQPEGKPFTWG